MKKMLSFILVLAVIFSLSTPVFAQDCSHAEETPAVFDWKDYETALSTKEYHFRLATAMKDKIYDHVKLLLVADGIVPGAATSENALNENVYSSFFNENVEIEYINETARAAFCCNNMRKSWITIAMRPTFSNDWCIKHTLCEEYRCTSCDSLYDTRKTDFDGCGGYRYSGTSYQRCFYADYAYN